MARYITFRCPDCEGQWEWLQHPSDEPYPERCELCNAWMGDDPPKAPVLRLNIGTKMGKSGDALFRKMEAGAEFRAQAAAEMTGASVSELGAMKITNMDDRPYEGENSAKMNTTVAEKNLSYATPHGVVGPAFQAQQNASQWGGETQSGPEALSTRRMIDSPKFRQDMQAMTHAATAKSTMHRA